MTVYNENALMVFDSSVSLETHVVLLPFLEPLGLLFSKGGHGVCNVRNDVGTRCAHKGETAPKRNGEGWGGRTNEGESVCV